MFLVGFISSTSDSRNSGGNLSFVRGAMLPWWRWKMNDVLSVLKIGWQESGEFLSFSTEASAILKALWDVSI